MGLEQEITSACFLGWALFRNIAHIFDFDREIAAVWGSFGHLFFIAYIINIYQS